jgi:uncharacterized protein with HEPN domain
MRENLFMALELKSGRQKAQCMNTRPDPNDFPNFEQNELIQTWIVHHLGIIGEAASKLGRPFQETHPSIPWAQLIAMGIYLSMNTLAWTWKQSGR